MNPVIVIATHKRLSITTTNIKLLHPYTVVLVVTDINEGDHYADFENVLIVMAPNEPLGAKWQAGVDFAREIPHSHLVITGSDDILSKDYLKNIPDFDFIGLRAWYILHTGILYELEYRAAGGLPLGGGRIYKREFLESIDYKIFDTSRQKLLDDLGWEKAKGKSVCIQATPEILAVKGNWPVMNKVDLRHKNVLVRRKITGPEVRKILKNKFNYDSNRIL